MDNEILFPKPSRTAAKIALLYLGISILWICFSDRVILFLFKDAETLTHAQTYKGWFFVTVTSLVLWFLLEKEIRRYRKTEEALRASGQYLRSIFRAAPTGIGVVSNRVFLAVNDRICTMTSYSREELVGRNAQMLYLNDAEYEFVGQENFRQINEHGTSTVETRWQCKDGHLIDVLLSSTPIDPHDLAAGVTFTALDITERKRAEALLRESEERFSRAFRSNPAPMVITDTTSGRFIDANQRWLELIGFSREEVMGRTSKEILIWTDPEERDRMISLLSAQGFIKDYPVALQTKSGETRYTLSSVERITINGQEALLSLIHDYTERQKVERALRESEEKFALAFAAGPDAISINRLADGLCVEVNDGFTHLTGFTREDVLGRTSLEIDIWNDPTDRQRLIESLIQQGSCENFEAVVRRKDGSLRTGLISARTISLHNEPHILSITRDITQRKQDEADLERLKVAIEHAGEVIVITDTAGNIQYANPAFETVTGYTIEEAYRQNSHILKSGEHDQAFYNELWSTISSGRTWTGRLINRKKDGTLYTEEAAISPVFDSQGKISNYVAIKRDITAHLKLETQYLQAQKMESVGRLTGGVAHDFNNILAIIIGYTEMALAQLTPSQRLHLYLEKILEAANRSADIVRQLLAFSRKQTIAPKVLDLNDTVGGMLTMLHRMIGENIELNWLPGLDLSPIKMDPTQIDQILANLCINARDAIGETGKITIATNMISLDMDYCSHNAGFIPGEYVVLSVSDNGCGIEKEVIDKIFEPFFTTKGHLGTGLGLATVYGIVKQNHGFINVYSEPGRGTTFKMYLPVHKEATIGREEEKPAELETSHGETILLVEDDPSILLMGRTMLEKLGYKVLTANSPTEALQQAGQDGAIDLLITDVIMPAMNGKELSEQLLALHPSLKLIYMSGYTTNVIAHHGVLDAGVHFLQKPFSTRDIAAKVREVLGEKNVSPLR